ncbi:hypothetical protein EAG_06488 [Camponotus floridanus]|uniref:Uncharacterized protein n=1 Tax=Camponotus floridanus TaxID=104421 RepID=E1ZYE7_CAMFO|nr:hypothetical protein EAG_06488 [Camponotus floridanus]
MKKAQREDEKYKEEIVRTSQMRSGCNERCPDAALAASGHFVIGGGTRAGRRYMFDARETGDTLYTRDTLRVTPRRWALRRAANVLLGENIQWSGQLLVARAMALIRFGGEKDGWGESGQGGWEKEEERNGPSAGPLKKNGTREDFPSRRLSPRSFAASVWIRSVEDGTIKPTFTIKPATLDSDDITLHNRNFIEGQAIDIDIKRLSIDSYARLLFLKDIKIEVYSSKPLKSACVGEDSYFQHERKEAPENYPDYPMSVILRRDISAFVLWERLPCGQFISSREQSKLVVDYQRMIPLFASYYSSRSSCFASMTLIGIFVRSRGELDGSYREVFFLDGIRDRELHRVPQPAREIGLSSERSSIVSSILCLSWTILRHFRADRRARAYRTEDWSFGGSGKDGRKENEKENRERDRSSLLGFKISSTVLENREKTTLRSAKLKEQAGWFLRGELENRKMKTGDGARDRERTRLFVNPKSYDYLYVQRRGSDELLSQSGAVSNGASMSPQPHHAADNNNDAKKNNPPRIPSSVNNHVEAYKKRWKRGLNADMS